VPISGAVEIDARISSIEFSLKSGALQSNSVSRMADRSYGTVAALNL
jgi:hypothetical protein